MAETVIDKKHTLGKYTYNLHDDIHRVAASAARKAVNEQFLDVADTLITNGFIISGSAASAGQMFVTASDSLATSDSTDVLVLCVKK